MAAHVAHFSPSAYGWSGVDLFLLISGFLIHANSISKPGPPAWKSFFSKRSFRIYPPYLFALVLFGLWFGPYSFEQWTWHLSMLFNLNEQTFYAINPSFWSLTLEMQLYAVYPLLPWFRGRWGIRGAMAIILGISIITMLWTLGTGPYGPAVRMSLPRLCILWAMGAWVAERYVNGRSLFTHHVQWLLVLLVLMPLVQYSLFAKWLFGT